MQDTFVDLSACGLASMYPASGQQRLRRFRCRRAGGGGTAARHNFPMYGMADDGRRFVHDSPLEGTGFELLVPRADGLGRRPQRYRCALARCLGGDAGCHHRTCLIRRWRERASNSRSGGWGELDRRAMSAERPEVSVRTNFGAGATALAWRERPLRRRGAPAISSRNEREPETTDEMRCTVASGASSMLAPTA